jgi:hypothetical protein
MEEANSPLGANWAGCGRHFETLCRPPELPPTWDSNFSHNFCCYRGYGVGRLAWGKTGHPVSRPSLSLSSARLG